MITYNKVSVKVWSMLGSRRTLGVIASELAALDEKFVFITADVGRYYSLDQMKKEHPDRLINVGIAEQNLIGVAAAMANEGFHVMAATYATFITARALDQIRVNLGLMGLPVTLVGVSAGFAEGDMSATHMALEDIADIRAIPDISIVSPADCTETAKALEASLTYGKPLYIRLSGVANEPIIYHEPYVFTIGKGIVLRKGPDIALVATGAMVSRANIAAKLLEQQGILCSVVDFHTIRPLDTELLQRLAASHNGLVTLEEHSVSGGLGSAIAEYFAPLADHVPQLLLGFKGSYPAAADYTTLLAQTQLDAEGIASAVLRFAQQLPRRKSHGTNAIA